MKFAITLLITTGLAWVAGLTLLKTPPSFLKETILLLAATTGGLYYLLLRVKANTPEYFTIVYLASLVIKLLALGAYIFVVVLNDQAGAMQNTIFFLGSYVIFTVLEVSFLYVKISR